MGTADMLPVCLIRKILCYLSYEEASRIRILSKTWLLAWLDHPNLEFTVSSGKTITIVDHVMERYKNGNIPIDKFELHNSTKSDHIFPLIDRWLGIALQNGVRHLEYIDVELSTSYPFPIFKFFEANFLRELVLTGCDLMHVSLSSASQAVTCHSLRNLSLSLVRLDNNMLQTILSSCPFIVDLIIGYCSRLKNIEIRNLPNIRSLVIGNDQPVKIQAPSLEYLYYSSSCLNKLNIVEHKNLKTLDISCTEISDVYLNHLISIPYCLEKLLLANIAFGRFDICRSQSLKVLKIHNCKIIGAIDAPNLVLLEYKGNDIPQLKFAQESRQLRQSQMILYPLFNVDSAWFCQLRKSLSDSTISWSQVTIYFHKCEEINMRDLLLQPRVAIPKVDILDVNFSRPNWEFPTFVDALLWSCHPRKLNLQSTTTIFTCFMYRFMQMKNMRHGQLKEAKAYKFDQKSKSWHPVEHKRGRDFPIRTSSKSKKYFFLLDW
uniref:F-box family protein n=1 Tax=Solanum tuberosum TaxID=4113 RepID=M1A6A3_SOLTU